MSAWASLDLKRLPVDVEQEAKARRKRKKINILAYVFNINDVYG